jgi:protein-tyrosine-phosphatase
MSDKKDFKKVVFICKRNRFRSQLTKALCNKFFSDHWLAESYGFLVRPEDEINSFSKNHKVGETIMGLNEIGVDISNECSKQLKPEHLNNIDKIVVVTEEEDIPDWFKKYPYEHWSEIKNFSGSPTLEKTRETIALINKRLLEFN